MESEITTILVEVCVKTKQKCFLGILEFYYVILHSRVGAGAPRPKASPQTCKRVNYAEPEFKAI